MPITTAVSSAADTAFRPDVRAEVIRHRSRGQSPPKPRAHKPKVTPTQLRTDERGRDIHLGGVAPARLPVRQSKPYASRGAQGRDDARDTTKLTEANRQTTNRLVKIGRAIVNLFLVPVVGPS